MITVERLIKLLNLQPHPEGGYYAETYRSNELIPKEALLERYAVADCCVSRDLARSQTR